MKNRSIVLTALLAVLVGSMSLRAQSATPAPSKIGVINIQAAIANTAEGKRSLLIYRQSTLHARVNCNTYSRISKPFKTNYRSRLQP